MECSLSVSGITNLTWGSTPSQYQDTLGFGHDLPLIFGLGEGVKGFKVSRGFGVEGLGRLRFRVRAFNYLLLKTG